MAEPEGSLDAERLREIEQRFDREMLFRPVAPWAGRVIAALLVAWSVFHYYSAWSSVVREGLFRGIFLAFVLAIVFLVYAASRRGYARGVVGGWHSPGGIPVIDWLLAAAAAGAALYLPMLPTDEVARRVGNPSTLDVVMGSLLLILVLEATRRSIGWTLAAIAVLFVSYALFGRQLPGILAHPGATWDGLVNHLYMTDQGIYGVAVGVVAKYVFLFVLFGELAKRVGLGQLFIDIASWVAGGFAGGPAKVAVVSSASFGMISGSSIANTVSTGALTIPMMKRIGYRPHFAGAVESTASTGGQITPPIMGAAAFIMIEYLQVSLREIILAALFPALLHYFGVLVMVHLEAKRLGLRGLRRDELPRIGAVLRSQWPALVPLAILLYMIITGRSPDNAAFWGITACIVIGFANPNIRFGPRDLIDAFRQGARASLAVGAAAACVGIIVGVVTLTGLGFRLSYMVTQLAAQLAEPIVGLIPFGLVTVAQVTLFLTLLFTAIACIIMGAGIPTTATYIVLVAIAAPALALLGVPQMVSHFFVFYFGVLADITPPVAVAAYAAAAIAGSNPFQTGNTAFRLAIAKALVPFVFVYSPSLLIVAGDFTWSAFVITLAGAVMGIALLGAAFTGYMLGPMRVWERWLLGIAALPMVAPGLESMAVGCAMAVPSLLRQLAIARRSDVPASAVDEPSPSAAQDPP